MRRRRTPALAPARLLLAFPLLVALACSAGSKESDEEGAASKPDAPAHSQPTPAGVTLTQEQAAHASLRVEVLKGIRKQGEASFPGRVLSVPELAGSRQALARALADETAARAQWQAADAQAKRLQLLFKEGANASQKATESANAAADQAKSQLDAAEAAFRSERARALQSWGESLARALESGVEPARSLLALERVPVLVTPGGQATFSPPPTCLVRVGEVTHPARFVSVLPRSDGALQGPGWLYAALPGPSGLPAGLNVEVLLPNGPEAEGVEVPLAAGVWWQGALWVYVDQGRNRYDRLLLSTPQPDEQGWFVTSSLKAGDRLVTTGAQILLSQELKAQGVTGDSGD